MIVCKECYLFMFLFELIFLFCDYVVGIIKFFIMSDCTCTSSLGPPNGARTLCNSGDGLIDEVLFQTHM